MINIKFCKKGEAHPEEVSITDEIYYLPLSDREEFLFDGIPKFNEPSLYLDIPATELNWLILIVPIPCDAKKVYRHQYINGLDMYMIHTKWPNGDESIIQRSRLSSDSYRHFEVSRHYDKPSWAISAVGIYNLSTDSLTSTINVTLGELLSFSDFDVDNRLKRRKTARKR